MTTLPVTALQEALRLVQSPTGLAELRARPLPEDVTQLFRLVSGDAASMAVAICATHETADVLREAAEFFVQQICFTPGIDSYRVLGIDRQASSERIREHYRLLVRWLHPDRNTDAWQNVYLDRVNLAWRDLRSVEARADYDLYHQPADPSPGEPEIPVATSAGPQPSWAHQHALGILSARTMRWLPGVVLASLGMLAVGLLVLMYFDHVDEQRHSAALLAASDPEPARAAQLDQSMPAQRDRETPGRVERRHAQLGPVPGNPAIVRSTSTEMLPPAGTSPAALMTQRESALQPERIADQVSAAELATPAHQAAPPADTDVTMTTSTPTAQPQTGATPFAASVPAPVPASAPATVDVAPAPAALAMINAGSDDAPEPRTETSASAIIGSSPTPALMAPTTAVASAPDITDAARANAAQSIDEALVSQLLGHYRDAYDDGDLIRLMALFTSDARNFSDGPGHLADTYRQLFESSRSRRLALNDMSWWPEGDAVAVVASFDASITPLGRQRPRHLGGDIRFDLRLEDGEVRIARIRHQAQ